MSETPLQPTPAPEITSDDKLMAALSYVFAPLVGIVMLLMEEKANRPFIKYHAVQSIAVSIVLFILVSVTAAFTFGCSSILLFVMLWYAYKAYQGEMFTVPVITDFIQGQGWV